MLPRQDIVSGVRNVQSGAGDVWNHRIYVYNVLKGISLRGGNACLQGWSLL